MSEIKISLLSHFKNLALITLFLVIYNSILLALIEPIVDFFVFHSRSLELNFLRIILLLLVQALGYFLVFYFGNFYFFPSSCKFINNYLLEYLSTFIFTAGFISIISFLSPTLWSKVSDFLNFYSNFGIFLSTFAFLLFYFTLNLAMVCLIWRYFDLRIRNEMKLTEKK